MDFQSDAVPTVGRRARAPVLRAGAATASRVAAVVTVLLLLLVGCGEDEVAVPPPPAAPVTPDDFLIIETIAGAGESSQEASGDGGAAIEATFAALGGIAIGPNQAVHVSDHSRVRRIDASGLMTTVAGTGEPGFAGDGGPATEALLDNAGDVAAGVASDREGALYVADVANNRVRKVDADGLITTVAGNGEKASSGDGGPAIEAAIDRPMALVVAPDGSILVSESAAVRKIDPDGVITTVAGTGTAGYAGDGGPATQAQVSNPTGLALDRGGNLYIADRGNHVVRAIGVDGVIRTVAGTGSAGARGDGGPATAAELSSPFDVSVDDSGNLYISDSGNHRIRRVDVAGGISSVVGTGRAGGGGDGGLAIVAELGSPAGIDLDADGNLYIADAGNGRVRRALAS